MTFSQPLGDTVALVEAPGASGLKVRNNPGVKTDWRGYAVVPYVSAYQENAVGIDTRSLGTETDIAESVVTVVPTRGAVVRASYKVATGYRALVKLLFKHKPVPFGAMVRVKNSDLISIVGNEGEVFLSGLNSSDAISVSWGQTSCQAKITFSPRPDVIQHATATCR
ncbi:fimbria/pilus outer membrane usher protein [Pantoea tagorei]